MALLLAKGEHLAEWRGVDEFVTSYRDAAINVASRHYPEAITATLGTICDELGALADENGDFTAQVSRITDQLSRVHDHEGLRTLWADFYRHAYAHFRRFAAPPAFFEVSNAFLRVLVSSQVAGVLQQSPEALPPFAVLVLGPAGRLECTRFCRIQLALVWEGNGTAAEDGLMADFGADLVTWLRSCGMALEEAVTPVHHAWRGTLEQWRERLEAGLKHGNPAALIELLRLVDQTVLVDNHGLADRFRALCYQQLHGRPAVANLVERCGALSNGLGMMGGFRLNRSGPYRGRFALLDHALVPLAACVGALCLHHDIVEDGTPRRLRELVRNGRLDVDLAERALQAWYLFSHHRLTLELQASAGQDCRDILNLDLTTLNQQQQEQLRAGLETVADLQRHLQVGFGQQA